MSKSPQSRRMKVLMVAPKICTPWSEGRKKLFRDLCTATLDRWDVMAVVTTDGGEKVELPVRFEEYISRSKIQHLLHIRMHLRKAIVRFQPDLVCHFPFGVVSGLRGLANTWIISYVERTCKQHKIPCCTLMYALAHGGTTLFQRVALSKVYRNQFSGSQRQIRFGVGLPISDPEVISGLPERPKNILFMAGMSEPSEERLRYTLDVRGLRFLLRAGRQLEQAGFRLIVAVPLLKDSKLLHAVMESDDNLWSTDAIEYHAEIKVPDIFERTFIFAFPYAVEELQFVPTSIVEAMYIFTPVIVPRLNFLAQFARQNPVALVYESDDLKSFMTQIDRFGHQDALKEICENAKKYTDQNYSIQSTVEDIERIYEDLARV